MAKTHQVDETYWNRAPGRDGRIGFFKRCTICDQPVYMSQYAAEVFTGHAGPAALKESFWLHDWR